MQINESAILTPKRTEYGKAIRKQYESGTVKESRHNMTELEPRTDGISNTLTTVQKDNLLLEVNKLGNIYGFDGGNYAENVYDSENIAPTLRSHSGGNTEPMIVAMRGRNPDNPSDRTEGSPTEQRLEPTSQGICNTITSIQKDNMVMERFVDLYNSRIREDELCGTITSNGNTSSTNCGTFGVIEKNANYRIRKLTPLEVWRLMDFSDEDFHKAESVNSNSQLYKQAGNSICRNVLVAIFGQLFQGKENLYMKKGTKQ